VPRFTVSALAGFAPLEVDFDASASSDPDGDIVSYSWTFGDGSTGSGRTVSHRYAEPGSYTPTLTVTDNRGAERTLAGENIVVRTAPGSGSHRIEGTVWHDADGDGRRGADEQTVPSLVVFLDDDDDGQLDSGEAASVTDLEGRYAFEGLDGTRPYTVTQALTLGWSNTAPGSGAASANLASRAPVLPIIGGGPADPGEFPFQVALVTASSGFQFCGGTFVAAGWVLTAAHCVDGATPQALRVLAGTYDLNAGGELLDVSRIFIHPNYSATNFVDNDIALLQLSAAPRYARVELLTPDRESLAAPGVTATVVGWGNTSNAGLPSSVLKKLQAVIITNGLCQTQLGNTILPVTICAGMAGSSESVCNGDSGGPLMVPFRSWWVQVGIVSFGANICFQPTAFARVSALVKFVTDRVPVERSGSVVVDWSGGVTEATVDFGNFR
jgi:PKD repeat protein